MPGARVLKTLPALCLVLAQALAAQEAPTVAPAAPPVVEAPLPEALTSPAAAANSASSIPSAAPAVSVTPPVTTAPPSAGGITAIDEPASPAATVLPPDERALLQARVDAIVQSVQREHDLAALTVSVVRDDALWVAQGYGLADVASARPVVAETTLFRIGSVSKTFIWTAVMMLAERGQIDLDADVNRYLKVVRIADAFGTPVTMRQLMHHRAGFEDSLRLFTVRDDDPRTLVDLLKRSSSRRGCTRRGCAPRIRTGARRWRRRSLPTSAASPMAISCRAKSWIRWACAPPRSWHRRSWTRPRGSCWPPATRPTRVRSGCRTTCRSAPIGPPAGSHPPPPIWRAGCASISTVANWTACA